MTFGTDIHVLNWMNYDHFGDIPMGLSCTLCLVLVGKCCFFGVECIQY